MGESQTSEATNQGQRAMSKVIQFPGGRYVPPTPTVDALIGELAAVELELARARIAQIRSETWQGNVLCPFCHDISPAPKGRLTNYQSFLPHQLSISASRANQCPVSGVKQPCRRNLETADFDPMRSCAKPKSRSAAVSCQP
jgi:hypothetical protein